MVAKGFRWMRLGPAAARRMAVRMNKEAWQVLLWGLTLQATVSSSCCACSWISQLGDEGAQGWSTCTGF